MQGSICTIPGLKGARATSLIIGVDDPARALEVLDASNLTRQAQRSDEGLRVILSEVPDLSPTRERPR